MQSNILINTNVSFVNIHDKTFKQLIQVNRPFFDDCNADNLLLLNGLYLTIQDMVLKIMDAKKMNGGYERKRKQKTMQKRKNKKNKKLKKKTRKYKGGNRNWVSKLIFSLMSVLLLMIHQNVLGVQPEYDKDVINRLVRAGQIKEIFENKHGTCAINTALFLGSINLKTYGEITESIIKRGSGLTFSEVSSYLNSSLNTLWEWDSISNTHFDFITEVAQTTRYLRGSLPISNESGRREKINEYIHTIKDKLIKMRNNMKHQREDQGILTALMYPSESVQHAVVAWLTSDETLVIIDPQEFMQGNVVLYMDDVNKTDWLSNKFLKVGLNDYFMKYLDERENGITLILRDLHIKKEEHLEEITSSNPMVNEVIERIKLLEGTGV